ncbi:fungal hydrophobin-domain-containing protein [Coprinopsis sp. MPI-PUGE-AT-0042]|nr:fungal hydrophobin-domain-containing protein [Coprinopsis sp. MPI-PUGE-AT-0042]
MQFKLLTTLALAAAAIAAPAAAPSCSTGPVQCCNSVSTAKDPATALLLGLLGVVVQDVNIPIGVTCSPISVIGLPGNSCNSQTVCCDNNNFNGVVAIGCTPININA